MTPGQLIQSQRLALGLTQEQAADRIGVTQAFWASLEGDRTSPRVATLAKVARALECRIADLVE